MTLDLSSRILYRDAMMLILDKPTGIPVHAGPGGGPNLEDGFDALRFGLPRLPALAHRLDRDTSGCLIVGRHRKALARLGKLFQHGRIEKVYWAIVVGEPTADSGRIAAPLAKMHAADKRRWRMKVDPAGQAAVTDWRVLARGRGRTWLDLRPRTGRTHQIRVHCAHAGWPVAGDPVYGDANGPLLLHARAIMVPLYPKKPPVVAYAPPPAHLADAIERMGADWRHASDPFLAGRAPMTAATGEIA